MRVLIKLYCETDMSPENLKWMLENYKKKIAKYGIEIKKITTVWSK